MASFSVPCPNCPCPTPLGLKSHKLSGLSLKPSLSFGSLSAESASSGILCLNRKQFSVQKLQAQHNEAAIAGNSNSAPELGNGANLASSKEKEDNNGSVSGVTVADAASVSAFMSQVSDLVTLVDSTDIVELQLKQANCELMIRKKEALEPPPATPMPQSSQPFYYPPNPTPPPPPPQASSPQASSSSTSAEKTALALPPPQKNTSSHPPMKCPMAGTFYRCPGPGEPPFVKVGDKVKKGQVICIVEAMKLMNEIEANQSGTIAEILVEDGKPVSVDTPLCVIVP